MIRFMPLFIALLLIASTGVSRLAYGEDAVKPTFSVRKDPATGVDQLIFSRGKDELKLGTFGQIRAGKVFFHWSDEESYARWTGPQGLSDAEFQSIRENFEGQMAGGGFYVSLDPLDSIQYGTKCTEIVAPRDLKYFIGETFPLRSDEIAILFPNAKKELNAAQATRLILEEYGADAWAYRNVWLNLLRRDALGEIHPVNPGDQISSFVRTQTRNILDWISYDLAVGLPKVEEFRRVDSDLYAYFIEGDRNPELMKRIRTRLIDEWIEAPLQESFFQIGRVKSSFSAVPARVSPTSSTLLNALRRDFKSDIEASFLKLIKKVKTAGGGAKIRNLKLNGIFMGVAPERLGLPPDGFTFARLPQIKYPVNAVPAGSNEFQVKLRDAIQYMDIADLVPEMAKGNPAPWTIYDEPGRVPFMERFRKYRKSVSSLGPVEMNNANLSNLLIEASSQLTENPHKKLRGTAAIGEGNVIVQGKRYYRISAWKKDRLLSHPLLVAEVIPDPEHAGSFLARHEYPSARTFRKFEKLLTPKLRSELSAAEKGGKLASGNTPEFQRLTESIIKELLLAAPNDSEVYFYWWASAVFPLGKDTDRVLSAAFSVNIEVPKAFRSWHETLFYSKEEFGLICDSEGTLLDYAIRMGDIEAVRANPTFPDFYGHSPLFDIYFNRPGITPPGDPWRAQVIKYLNSAEGQRAISEEKVLTSLNPKDCMDLLRPVGRH